MVRIKASSLFRLATHECCNYTDRGPFNLAHYCWMEPRQTEHVCMIYQDIPCRWFRDAILPLKPELGIAWDEMVNRNNPAVEVGTNDDHGLVQCQCGVTYKPKSNRQDLCPECSEKRAKTNARERKRRQREK